MGQESDHPFVDRRGTGGPKPPDVPERRQFIASRDEMPEDVRELAQAIDAYKVNSRRRFITLEEVLQVVKGLGYHK